MPAAVPLQAIQPLTQLDAAEDYAEWDGQSSERTFHIFVNETEEDADLYWYYDTAEEHYGTIAPSSNLYVGTYTFHQWKVKQRSTGRLLGRHSGPSSTVYVREGGCEVQHNGMAALGPAAAAVAAAAGAGGGSAGQQQRQPLQAVTPQGVWAVRAHVLGMPVWAFDCVCDAAVARAVHVASRMLQGCDGAVLRRMVAAGAALGVFGRGQSVTDPPPHRFMRHNLGRDLTTTARGLGGCPAVPLTTCGEENLVMEDDRFYPCQSILIHELAHAVMNLGFEGGDGRAGRGKGAPGGAGGWGCEDRLRAAYTAALNEGLYPAGCYMMSNELEYWAVGAESWFESTLRTDINGGASTRAQLKAHDPRLAAVMAEVFGDGEWRYTHDCPRPLSWLVAEPAAPAAAAGAVAAEAPAAAAAAGAGEASPSAAASVSSAAAAAAGAAAVARAAAASITPGGEPSGCVSPGSGLQAAPMSRDAAATEQHPGSHQQHHGSGRRSVSGSSGSPSRQSVASDDADTPLTAGPLPGSGMIGSGSGLAYINCLCPGLSFLVAPVPPAGTYVAASAGSSSSSSGGALQGSAEVTPWGLWYASWLNGDWCDSRSNGSGGSSMHGYATGSSMTMFSSCLPRLLPVSSRCLPRSCLGSLSGGPGRPCAARLKSG